MKNPEKEALATTFAADVPVLDAPPVLEAPPADDVAVAVALPEPDEKMAAPLPPGYAPPASATKVPGTSVSRLTYQNSPAAGRPRLASEMKRSRLNMDRFWLLKPLNDSGMAKLSGCVKA